MKLLPLFRSVLAAEIISEQPLLVGSAYIDSSSPIASYCPISGQICIAVSYDTAETCFTVHSAQEGWAAVGFGENGMLNAEIYAGWKNTTSGFTVASLQSGSSKIQPGKQAQQVARPVSLFYSAPAFAKFSFAFCKPIGSGKPISAGQQYIYATCSLAPTGSIDTADANFDVHDGPHGSFLYDFTNSSAPIPNPNGQPILSPNLKFTIQTVYLLHGILMWIAWMVSPFLGIFIARYMKSKLGHNWYRLHVFFMGFCTIMLTLGSFVLIFLYQRPPHFSNSIHAVLGLVVVIVCVIQGVLGFLSNLWFDPDRMSVPVIDMAHWWVGRLVFVAGIINSYLGILIYETNGFSVSVIVKVIHFVVLALGFSIMAGAQLKYGPDIHIKDD